MIDMNAMNKDIGMFWTVAKADLRALASALEAMERECVNLRGEIKFLTQSLQLATDTMNQAEQDLTRIRELNTNDEIEEILASMLDVPEETVN